MKANEVYSKLKKVIDGLAVGIEATMVSGTTLTIVFKNGTKTDITFPEPKDGVSVTDAQLKNNELVISLSDGSSINVGNVKGDKGDTPDLTDYATKSDVANVEVGARNYIKYGKGDKKLGLFKSFDKVENGYAETTFTSNDYTAMKSVDDGFVLKCRDYEVGRTIVFSYDIMYTNIALDEGASIKEFTFGQRYTSSSSLANADGAYRKVTMHTPPMPKDENGNYILNQWVHVRRIITIPEQAESTVKSQCKFGFWVQNGSGTITLRMKNVKIEYGNKETDYRPSVEEIQEQIDNMQEAILALMDA